MWLLRVVVGYFTIKHYYNIFFPYVAFRLISQNKTVHLYTVGWVLQVKKSVAIEVNAAIRRRDCLPSM